jgi:hypothetical protein
MIDFLLVNMLVSTLQQQQAAAEVLGYRSIDCLMTCSCIRCVLGLPQDLCFRVLSPAI